MNGLRVEFAIYRIPLRVLGVMEDRSACRSLFGSVDHGQLQEDLEREMRRIATEKKETWNFDFEKEQPLPGKYEWQKVQNRDESLLDRQETLDCENSCFASSSDKGMRLNCKEDDQRKVKADKLTVTSKESPDNAQKNSKGSLTGYFRQRKRRSVRSIPKESFSTMRLRSHHRIKARSSVRTTTSRTRMSNRLGWASI